MFIVSSVDVLPISCVIFMCLLYEAVSQCSEAHRQTCSYPYLQLRSLNSELSPGRYVPDYNETTLLRVCNLYKEYKNCSEPFLSTCNQQTLTELSMFEASLGLLCGDLFHDYLREKNCYLRHYTSYNACDKRQTDIIHQSVDNTRPSDTNMYILCSAAREYGYCIYTATALGCTIHAANVYYKILNQSVSSIFNSNGYSCHLYDPLEVISLFTTSSSTVSTTNFRTTRQPTDNPNTKKQFREVAGSMEFKSMHILYYLVLILLSYSLARLT